MYLRVSLVCILSFIYPILLISEEPLTPKTVTEQSDVEFESIPASKLSPSARRGIKSFFMPMGVNIDYHSLEQNLERLSRLNYQTNHQELSVLYETHSGAAMQVECAETNIEIDGRWDHVSGTANMDLNYEGYFDAWEDAIKEEIDSQTADSLDDLWDSLDDYIPEVYEGYWEQWQDENGEFKDEFEDEVKDAMNETVSQYMDDMESQLLDVVGDGKWSISSPHGKAKANRRRCQVLFYIPLRQESSSFQIKPIVGVTSGTRELSYEVYSVSIDGYGEFALANELLNFYDELLGIRKGGVSEKYWLLHVGTFVGTSFNNAQLVVGLNPTSRAKSDIDFPLHWIETARFSGRLGKEKKYIQLKIEYERLAPILQDVFPQDVIDEVDLSPEEWQIANYLLATGKAELRLYIEGSKGHGLEWVTLANANPLFLSMESKINVILNMENTGIKRFVDQLVVGAGYGHKRNIDSFLDDNRFQINRTQDITLGVPGILPSHTESGDITVDISLAPEAFRMNYIVINWHVAKALNSDESLHLTLGNELMYHVPVNGETPQNVLGVGGTFGLNGNIGNTQQAVGFYISARRFQIDSGVYNYTETEQHSGGNFSDGRGGQVMIELKANDALLTPRRRR